MSFKINGKLILPMNAYQMGKNKSHIVYPCYGQPKLDGNRCLAFLRGDKVILISRRGKLISHLDGIRTELDKIFRKFDGLYLDGELHIDGSDDIGLLRRVLGRKTGVNKEIEGRIIFYIFDGFLENKLEMNFKNRWQLVKSAVGDLKLDKKLNKKIDKKLVRLVPTFIVKSERNVDKVFKKMLNDGYEGLVLRNFEGDGYLLDGKRSKDVITSKSFGRKLFEVIGYKEGIGKDKGSIIFKLKCLGGEFWARPMGSMEDRKRMYKDGDKFLGKRIWVKYIEIDEKSGCVTRNPVVNKL